LPLRILLVTGTYLPIKNGGIENYTHQLALLLFQNQSEVEIAGLNTGSSQEYFYEGVKVNNLKGSFESFEGLLEKGDFDICHFHEYSAYGGIEIHWLKKAKEYCRKVFFTFHLPYLTCYKNDFRYKGITDCNHFTNPEKCTACIIVDRLNDKKWGKSETVIKIIETVLSISGRSEKLKTKVIENNRLLTELLATCDEVFIIANWFKKLLEDNGYNSDKIKLIPNNLNPIISNNSTSLTKPQKNKMVFAGRIQHQKGLHLLCEAMQKINTRGIEIDVYGNKTDEEYFRTCQAKYPFVYKGIIERKELLTLLPDYDFMVLPSVFTEMYPMVIQEAFNSGLPVIASAAKGNVNVIKDSENGFLFEYANAKDLALTIDKAYYLKQEGWKPSFTYPDDSEKDVAEILSYYK
jgi:glycosyltransferase involved in cell wall biosynthesis